MTAQKKVILDIEDKMDAKCVSLREEPRFNSVTTRECETSSLSPTKVTGEDFFHSLLIASHKG